LRRYAQAMRIALALTGLLCSAVGAYAFPADNVPYCSSGFDKPAMLVFKSGHATLTIGKKTMKFSAHEPLEGVDGIAFVAGDSGETADNTLTEAYAVKIGEDEVLLFKDRVFWPCEND
jgi:hypothetical protein